MLRQGMACLTWFFWRFWWFRLLDQQSGPIMEAQIGPRGPETHPVIPETDERPSPINHGFNYQQNVNPGGCRIWLSCIYCSFTVRISTSFLWSHDYRWPDGNGFSKWISKTCDVWNFKNVWCLEFQKRVMSGG
jgi:hypothetical protein